MRKVWRVGVAGMTYLISRSRALIMLSLEVIGDKVSYYRASM
jgi:hypothetical protein